MDTTRQRKHGKRARLGRLFRLLMVAALLGQLILMAPAHLPPNSPVLAPRPTEKKFRRLINAERVDDGKGRLAMKDKLVRVARKHSKQMASDGYIYHNENLPGALPYDNVWWGENVGVGGGVDSLHGLFMDSDAHRANILGKNYDRVGVGVVKSDDRIWVTVVFVG